jgi:hypothetical protein
MLKDLTWLRHDTRRVFQCLPRRLRWIVATAMKIALTKMTHAVQVQVEPPYGQGEPWRQVRPAAKAPPQLVAPFTKGVPCDIV